MTDNVGDDSGGRWMTYSEVAGHLGISVDAAKRRAARGRWGRRLHNADGRARVLVPPNVAPGAGGHVVPFPTPARAAAGGDVAPAVAALAAALDAAREAAGRQDAELARLRDALRVAEAEAATGQGEVRRLEELVTTLRSELDRLHDTHRLAVQHRPEPVQIPSFGSLVARLRALFGKPAP